MPTSRVQLYRCGGSHCKSVSQQAFDATTPPISLRGLCHKEDVSPLGVDQPSRLFSSDWVGAFFESEAIADMTRPNPPNSDLRAAGATVQLTATFRLTQLPTP